MIQDAAWKRSPALWHENQAWMESFETAAIPVLPTQQLYKEKLPGGHPTTHVLLVELPHFHDFVEKSALEIAIL